MWENPRVWPFFIMQNHFNDYVLSQDVGLVMRGLKTAMCAYVCVCVHDFRWSERLSLKCPVASVETPEIKKTKRDNTEQPRAVLASKMCPPIFPRQILVSVNMASKAKAWLYSNKCSMCMPWVNDVNVIFISSEYNSIRCCLLLLRHVWTHNQWDEHLRPLGDQSVERWVAIGLHEQIRLLNSGRGGKTTIKVFKTVVKVCSDGTQSKCSPRFIRTNLTAGAFVWSGTRTPGERPARHMLANNAPTGCVSRACLCTVIVL